jgi:uncharacterized protein (DUF924 family)
MINEILTFWFDYENNPKALYNRAIWWEKSSQTDNNIRQNFEKLTQQATSGELTSWLESAKGTLAYIILIDQFSRNLYRDTPQMYTHDSLALDAAKMAIAKGFDKELTLTERIFIYLPFEHSEDLNEQETCLTMYQQLIDDAPEESKQTALELLGFAKAHYDIIEKFNRFPHRNKILSRDSTADEIEFMKTHSGF